MSEGLTRVVVLAAGRGSRMRNAAPGTTLDNAQQIAAERGLKGLIPFEGEPFLAHVLTAVAEAGFSRVCMVTAPGVDPIREYFAHIRTERLRMEFAIQHEPLGTAHALLAAEPFSAGGDVAVINSDNLYPPAALAALRDLTGSGLIGFARDGLQRGNIDSERIAGYALIEMDDERALTRIVEKPDAATLSAAGASSLVSMTCWRFGPGIFDAIRQTPLSVRGEYELPDAVRVAMRHERFSVVPMDVPVLDLSTREDIARVGELLRGRRVDL